MSRASCCMHYFLVMFFNATNPMFFFSSSCQHGIQESPPLQIGSDSVWSPAAEAPLPLTCHPSSLLCQHQPSATPSPPLLLPLQTPHAAPEVSVRTRLPTAALFLGGTAGGTATEAALHPVGIRRRRRLHC